MWHSLQYITNAIFNFAYSYVSVNSPLYEFESVKNKQQTNENRQNNNECPICYEQIEHDANTMTTSCHHTFHSSCLVSYICTNLNEVDVPFRGNKQCPCCRTSLTNYSDANNSNKNEPSTLPETMKILLNGNPKYIPTQVQLLEAFAHYEYYNPNETMPYLSSYSKVINMWNRAAMQLLKVAQNNKGGVQD